MQDWKNTVKTEDEKANPNNIDSDGDGIYDDEELTEEEEERYAKGPHVVIGKSVEEIEAEEKQKALQKNQEYQAEKYKQLTTPMSKEDTEKVLKEIANKMAESEPWKNYPIEQVPVEKEEEVKQRITGSDIKTCKDTDKKCMKGAKERLYAIESINASNCHTIRLI
jgi:hypothetical protein